MELVNAIQQRKSIRGYKSTPVPKEVLAEILDLACRALSGLNAQPWEFVILTGESLEKAKKVNGEQAMSGAEMSRDVRGYELKGLYRERQVALGKEMFRLMDMNRDDTQKRTEWGLKGMRFYDAPAAILVCTDEMILNEDSQMALVDIGIVAQTIALVAVKYDLGTCIQGASVVYASALKKALGIPESKLLVLALAIGYPNWDFPANQLRSDREPLSALVTWKS